MTSKRANFVVLLLLVLLALALQPSKGVRAGEAAEGAALRIVPRSQALPLEFWGATVGTVKELVLELPKEISAYEEAILLLHVNDIDAPNETDMFVNDQGPSTWPQSIIGEGQRGGAIPIHISDLRPGRNLLKFIFKDNLNNTTQGFSILEAELDLFKQRSDERMARIVQDAASWGKPNDWCPQDVHTALHTAPSPRQQQSATVRDFFQNASAARWRSAGGTWKKTIDQVELYDIDQRDIYFSPEEPGHLAWTSLWRERDGTIKISFAQITGNPALEPSYRPWYGRGRTEEEWVQFATKDHKMGIGPEDAVSTTNLELPVLATTDNGDSWEHLVGDKSPGHNWRPVTMEDGRLINNGISTIQCRDGRLVSTVWGEEWAAHKGCILGIRESLDGGETWLTTQYIMPPEGTDPEVVSAFTEENDMVELEDGRLLVMLNTSPGSPSVTYLTRTGPGHYEATPPFRTSIPNSGLPELLMGSDGVIWYWNIDGHYYSLDEGQSWHATKIRYRCYYGKMMSIGSHRLLCVTQYHCHDDPYPNWQDASIRQYRFSYRRSGIMEQTDNAVPLALNARTNGNFGDLHLFTDVRVDGVNGLAFRVQPEGESYYIFAVILPSSELYQRWFPPEVQAQKLSAVYHDTEKRVIAEGHPMAVLGRVDNGQVTVLRGMRLTYIPRGSWVQMQIKVTGDLLQGAVKCGPEETPVYVGARDSAYKSGEVGLFTAQSTGAFRGFYAWDSPQMIRDLWQRF